MKYISLLICFIFPLAGWAQKGEQPFLLNVYDSQTRAISQIKLDPHLLSLKGKPPTKQENQEEEPVAATVINGEDWYQVNGRQYPYSAVVYLDRKGFGGCSAAMIGPYTVLTAAHCVYKNIEHNNGTMYNPVDITAYAGGEGSSIRAKGTRILAAPGTEKQNWGEKFQQMDYAIVVLDKPIGNKSGTLGARAVGFQKGQNISLMGFPATKNHQRPWLSRGQITGIYQGYVYFNADVLPGNSGGPLFANNDLSSLVGVVSFENTNFNGATNPAHNALLSFINKYRNEKPTGAQKKRSTPHQTKQDVQSDINDLIERLKHK